MKPVRRPSYYEISNTPIRFARNMYSSQKHLARIRTIPFLLTFVEWLVIWEMSGKLDERGRERGKYCMARKNDIGPYAWWNVDIIEHGENVRLAQKGKKVKQSTKDKISQANRKRRKLTVEQVLEIRKVYSIGNKWHGKSAHSAEVLAKMYGVDSETIRNAVYKRPGAYVIV